MNIIKDLRIVCTDKLSASCGGFFMGMSEIKKEHEIVLVKRSEMSVSGVCEVISFDEESVRLKSVEG